MKYDVVVAGGGIGGLCAGALLARHGYKVLLVEALHRMGGRFSTIEQEGFKTPTCALAVATRGVIDQTFKDAGAPFNVRELGATTAWLWGEWHELPEKGQIRSLLSILEKMGAEKTKIMGRLAQGAITEKVLGAFRGRASRSDDPTNLMSFRDWLEQYTDDERVLQLFHALTSAISTVNDFEYPASHWFTYVSASGQGGMPFHGLSPNGNVENANALADVIRKQGGDAWVDAPLKHIDIHDGNVNKVLVSREGKDIEIEMQLLVSDLGPKKTVALAGRNCFPVDYLNQVDSLRPAPIVANVIASDVPLIVCPGGLLIVGARRIVAGMPLTNRCPELAPPGQHLTVVWGTPASCLQHVNPQEEALLNLEDIRRVFPLFEKHGRLLRQDIHDIDDEFPALRSWMGYDMPQTTPIGNLIHVGDAVKPFGWEGLAACAQSAKVALGEVRKRIKPGK